MRSARRSFAARRSHAGHAARRERPFDPSRPLPQLAPSSRALIRAARSESDPSDADRARIIAAIGRALGGWTDDRGGAS